MVGTPSGYKDVGTMMHNVDLVYLWVDSGDTGYRRKYSEYRSILKSKERFRSNDELKYSLRSVDRYMPWINNIFIVTEGQVPEWLNTPPHPKIRIISHRDIMPEKSLPTFNSMAIETCLWRIPGLSEFFLYANDDIFVNQRVGREYFFTKKGKPVVYVNKLSKKLTEYTTHLVMCNHITEYARKFVDCVEPVHSITAYRKSYYEQVVGMPKFKELFDYTALCRTRNLFNIQRFAISLWLHRLGLMEFRRNNPWYFWHHYRECVYMTPRHLEKLDKYKYKFFCINDDEKATRLQLCGIKDCLERKFPEKSRFEK
jgi:hypothetical protein